MNHPPGMCVGHRLADLLEDPQEPRQVVRRVGALLQQRRQSTPFYQLHGEVGPAVVKCAQLIDGHDAGMLELAADLCLFDESAAKVGVILVLFKQDLDREVAPQVRVASLEDGTHAAVADLSHDLVAAGLLRHLR